VRKTAVHETQQSGEIDVAAVDIPDLNLHSALAASAKSRWTGSAAAIANAVFHATGKGVRDLPITADKLI
jgi:xanthine dehydrogenase YagR molybdenum-binding subunit